MLPGDGSINRRSRTVTGAQYRARLLTFVLACVLNACQNTHPDLGGAAIDAVRLADSAWEKVVSRRDLEGAVAFVEPSGSILAPNAQIATGPDAVRALFSGLYATPGLSVHWQPTRIEAARSGDLAFSSGGYVMTHAGPNGPATDRGKYATVWRKQPDGTWKVVLDVFNSDLPEGGN